MKKNVVILGSTGSIGTQALDVIRTLRSGGDDIVVTALAAYGGNPALLERQAREFMPRFVSVVSNYGDIKARLADTAVTVIEDGNCELAGTAGNLVLNAVTGGGGLYPTLAAVEAGNDVALANKESLVVGGELVMGLAAERGVAVIPVDSEHSAIFQCLHAAQPFPSQEPFSLPPNENFYNKIILTASGGAFFGYNKEQLRGVTREQALSNPNWDMGAKVTVDSCTLMNKGLEFIEAMHLFGASARQIEVVVHRESIVHSAVEFADGAVIAQLAVPDMRLPIQYALTYPARVRGGVKQLSLADTGRLTFAVPDRDVFPLLALAEHAAVRGGNAGCILNGADEAAVAMFLRGRIQFCEIAEVVTEIFGKATYYEKSDIHIIKSTVSEVKDIAEEIERSGKWE